MPQDFYYFDGENGCPRCQSHEGFYEEEIRPHPHCDCDIEEVEIEFEFFLYCETRMEPECPVEENTYVIEQVTDLDLCYQSGGTADELRFDFSDYNSDELDFLELMEECGWSPPQIRIDEGPIDPLPLGFFYEVTLRAEVYEATMTAKKVMVCYDDDGDSHVLEEEEFELTYSEVVAYEYSVEEFLCD